MKLHLAIFFVTAVAARSVKLPTNDVSANRIRRRGSGGRRRNDKIMLQIVRRVNRRQRLLAQFERMKQIVAGYEQNGGI